MRGGPPLAHYCFFLGSVSLVPQSVKCQKCLKSKQSEEAQDTALIFLLVYLFSFSSKKSKSVSLGWGSFLGGQYPGQEAALLLGWLSMLFRQGFLQKRLLAV